jgi:four helix bundle protein
MAGCQSGVIEYQLSQSAREPEKRFHHERLDVYQTGLAFMRWFTAQPGGRELSHRLARRIDQAASGIVLNIAEGNGRYAQLDHARFLEMAAAATVKASTYLCGDRRLARRSWRRHRVRSLCEESWLCWKRCLPAREFVRATKVFYKRLGQRLRLYPIEPKRRMDRVSIRGEFGIGVPILLSETFVGNSCRSRPADKSFRQEISTRG